MTENANHVTEVDKMVDLAELEAAIAAGFETLEHYIKELSGYEYNATANYFGEPERPPQLTTALAAFAAYRDRFHALEADNERTNRDRSALCVDFALLTEENARLRETLRQIHNNAPKQEPIQPHPQNYPQAHSFWVAGQLAAAVLADSEGE